MATTPVTNPAGEPTPQAAPVQHPPYQNPAVSAGISQEELDRRLADARRDEKGKLYPEIERLKREQQENERKLRDLQTALEAANAKSAEADGLKEQISKMEKKLTATADQFSKAIDDAMEAQSKEFEKQRAKDRLDAQREALLRANPEVIPELVTGNTPEELQANFEKAKAKYKEIEDRAAAKVREELGVKDALRGPGAPGSGSGSGSRSDSELANWRNMSPAEWEQKKRSFKEEAFRKAGLPMSTR